jgi:hypothetical protein
MASDASYLGILQWGISVTVPAVAGLAGVAVGAYLTARREKVQRRHDFAARQLKDFYSPLLAIRKELRAMGELRLKISNAESAVWDQICQRYQNNPEALQTLSEKRGDKFGKHIEYNNKKLVEEALPAYHRMIAIFRENMWLAEPSTVAHLPVLLEFVDIWDRWLSKTISAEALESLNHTEESLYPLYNELQEKHDELREKLAKGEA